VQDVKASWNRIAEMGYSKAEKTASDELKALLG